MNKFIITFTKLTAWPAWLLCFRPKIHYEDKKTQGRKIKGPAIIISNHTSVYDYALFLFVFFGRTLRYQMAEVLFKKKFLGWFLKRMGGIFIDRDSYNFSFVETSVDILNEGGVVGIFPESRLPRKGEVPPLPFKPSAAYIGLESDASIIPVYTNGKYFGKARAELIIGKPMYLRDYVDENLTKKENLRNISEIMRGKILELRDELQKRKEK